jgi:hypothetical protein
MRAIYLFLCFFQMSATLFSQVKPLIPSKFTNRILSENSSVKYISYNNQLSFLDTIAQKKDQFQQIIKTDKTAFITTSGTGIVYEQKDLSDSIVYFSRIDSTIYDGYNFDDIKFSYRDTLFSVGGFGYWRNNGQIRYFSENKEWELLFPEILFGISSRNIWNLDSKNGLLSIIAENSDRKSCLLKINLSKHRWEIHESFNNLFENQILNANEKPVQIQLNNGGSLLVYTDKVYYLNLSMNTLKIETDKSLTNFFNKFNVRNNPVVNIDDKLIIAHILENKIDSVSFSINNFSDIAPILNDNKQFSRNWIFLILGLVVLIIGIAFYFKFSKKPVILFSEFEKQFLKKLLSKSGKQLDIDSLNYLLGLSKKSVEIQKKNRSEFLNKLDQKLRELLNTEDVLIIRVKDESDKRIFLYQLNEAFFDQINKLV